MKNKFNTKVFLGLIGLFLFSFTWIACERKQENDINPKSENNSTPKKEKKIKSDSLQMQLKVYQGTYDIPPVGGPGTGACWITFLVKGDRLSGIKTCGVHDHSSREEIETKLFEVPFFPHKVYKVSSLVSAVEKEDFGCDFFEFKNNSVYLYDKNMKVVHDDFCCGFSEVKCDCIFPNNKYQIEN